MADKIKIGIIGVGQIGKQHVGNYKKIPGAEIVAVADIDEPEAKRVAAENNIPQVFTNFHDLLDLDEIQAVDVCLHNNLHAPVTIAALNAGKNVYCEKPMAGSLADAKKMLDTAQKKNLKLSIQLATIFAAETKAAKRLIDGGHLGKIYSAHSKGFRRRGRPYVDGYGTSFFVQKPVAAGGALFDMGVYHITQVMYLLGNPEILSVSGATHQETDMYEDRRKKGMYSVEELALGFIRLAGGISLCLEESWAVHMDGGDSSRIFGSKGGVKLSPFSYHRTIEDMEMNGTFDLGSADWRWHQCIPDTNAYDSPQHHWIAALQDRVPLMDTTGLALAAMKISEGIYLSQAKGREVTGKEIEKSTKSTAIKGL
ncbi:MAG TPA: Gfo/Idh/MocA family oxidoreductase [Candidatus Brocadiia bacterium]|nr:Gfo/Idh/MocA family oxidoreductase [Candidatus Brocadiia bacterium]